mmetsp:Transcript_17729/g.26898  ORF Transcript_17729/g.26898 Transcript_17729/m.26898 type:complete len:214 (-) Transcript_17729:308-949(-)
MNNGLGMNYNVNVVVTRTKQIMSFNDFQSLVHHSSTIECNFCSHVPIGMRRGLGLDGPGIVPAHMKEFFLGQIPKGTTAGGQNYSSESTGGDALQTLKNGGMFRIGGQHVNPIFLHQWINHGTTANQRFLVGQRNVLFQFNGLNGGLQSRRSDNARHDGIGRIDRGGRQNALVTTENLSSKAFAIQIGFQLCRRFRCCHAGDLGLVFQALFGH